MSDSEQNRPKIGDFYDSQHPLRWPESLAGSNIGKEHERRMQRNWELLTYTEPRATWPFKLVRVPDAVRICEETYHLHLPRGAPSPRQKPCFVCGKEAKHEYVIHWSTPIPHRWLHLYLELRRRKGFQPIEHILGHLVEKPFCSKECFASAMLWSLYLPVSRAQLCVIPLLFPIWAYESRREDKAADKRHKEISRNLQITEVDRTFPN